MKLKNPELLQQANYWDGLWRQASSVETIEVKNPANQVFVGRVPRVSR